MSLELLPPSLLFQKVFTAIAPPRPHVVWVIEPLDLTVRQCVHPWDQSATSVHFLFC